MNHAVSRRPPRPSNQRESVNLHYDTRLPRLPWSRRIQIPIIAAAVYSVICALGPTLRYEMLGYQHIERVYSSGRRCIFAFWHRVIIPVVWWARNRGIVVLNTTAFDGQWTRKVIEWLGFGTAQGSSTRGGFAGWLSWPGAWTKDWTPDLPSMDRAARVTSPNPAQ